MKPFIWTTLTLLLLSGCGVPRSELEKLKEENSSLRKEVEELKYGANRLVAQCESAYNDKRYADARMWIKALQEKHPESPKNADFRVLLVKINEEETKQKEQAAREAAELKRAATAEAEKRTAELLKQKEQAMAAEKERLRIANLNNTGMWSIGTFVDKFGERTKDRYITNTDKIIGSFGNTATEGSPVGVEFLICPNGNYAFQLYEYNRSTPVKSSREDRYSVNIRCANGVESEFLAINTSDRLVFVPYPTNTTQRELEAKLTRVFLSEGGLKFFVRDIETPTTTYRFAIENPDGFGNALRLIAETR